jgi:hypothetical protein
MKRLVVLVAAVAALALAPRPSEAAYIIDFGRGTATSGQYSCVGGVCQTTVGIALGVMQFSGDNGLTWTVYDTIGGGTDASGGNGAAVLTFNTSTNTFVLTGGVVGLAGLGGGSNTLLTGTFSGFSGGSFFQGWGQDTKNPTLLSDLGIPGSPFVFRLSMFGRETSPGSGLFNVTSGDLENTPVPEPGSMVLFGSGLLGLAAIARRRMRKA